MSDTTELMRRIEALEAENKKYREALKDIKTVIMHDFSPNESEIGKILQLLDDEITIDEIIKDALEGDEGETS